MVAKKFRCECSQTQPMFAVFNTVMGTAMLRVIFCLKEKEKVCVIWQNKGWIKVTITEDWKKVKGHVVKQRNLEENESFPRYLVIEIEER